jgi:hypothetical protein
MSELFENCPRRTLATWPLYFNYLVDFAVAVAVAFLLFLPKCVSRGTGACPDSPVARSARYGPLRVRTVGNADAALFTVSGIAL